MLRLSSSSTRQRVSYLIAGQSSRQRSGASSYIGLIQGPYCYSGFAADHHDDDTRLRKRGTFFLNESIQSSTSYASRNQSFSSPSIMMNSTAINSKAASLGGARYFSSSPNSSAGSGDQANDSSLEYILNKLSNESAVSVEDGVGQTVNTTVELSNYNPADLMLQLLSSVHEFSGPEVPYAFVIFGMTVAIRTAFLPLAISQQRNASRMAHMKPEMELMKERMERVQAQGSVTPDINLKMANEMKGLFKKYGKCIKSFPIHGQNFLTLTFATCKIVTLSSLSYSQ